jgi:hypothetical protein
MSKKSIVKTILVMGAAIAATGCSMAQVRKPAQVSATSSSASSNAPIMQCVLTKNGWNGMPTDLSQIPSSVQPPAIVFTTQKPLVAANTIGPPTIILYGASTEQTSDNKTPAYTFEVSIYPGSSTANGYVDAQVSVIVTDNVNKSLGVEQLNGVNISNPDLSFEATAYAGNFSSGAHLLCSLLQQN